MTHVETHVTHERPIVTAWSFQTHAGPVTGARRLNNALKAAVPPGSANTPINLRAGRGTAEKARDYGKSGRRRGEGEV